MKTKIKDIRIGLVVEMNNLVRIYDEEIVNQTLSDHDFYELEESCKLLVNILNRLQSIIEKK